MTTTTKPQRTQSNTKAPKFTPPKDLTASGKKLFQLLAEHLESIRFLEPADVHLLGQYCRLNDGLDKAMELIAKEGVIVDASHGVKAHPAVPASTQLTGSMAKIGGQLGIGAGARKRLQAEVAKAEADMPNPWSKPE